MFVIMLIASLIKMPINIAHMTFKEAYARLVRNILIGLGLDIALFLMFLLTMMGYVWIYVAPPA